MWQQNPTYDSSNGVDVTNQFNVSSKNAMDYSNVNGFQPTQDFQTNPSSCMYEHNGKLNLQIPGGAGSFNGGSNASECAYMNTVDQGGASGCNFGGKYLNSQAAASGIDPGCNNRNAFDKSGTYFDYLPSVTLNDIGVPSINSNVPSAPLQPLQQTKPNKVVSIETPAVDSFEMKLALREKDINQRIFYLRSAGVDAIDDVEKYYQTQTTEIDNERHTVLQKMKHDKTRSGSVHKYYNRKLMGVMESMEEKLSSLESSRSKCSGGKKNKKHVVDRKSTRLFPKHVVKLMEDWYIANVENPYPTRQATVIMATAGGVSVEQIRKWFANKRNRARNEKLKTHDISG